MFIGCETTIVLSTAYELHRMVADNEMALNVDLQVICDWFCYAVLKPCTLRDWELHVHFDIHGEANELYGDGIAIWYTKHRLELGLYVFMMEANFLQVLFSSDSQ